MKSIGIIGVGRAGSAMAYILDEAGYEVKVVLHNQEKEKLYIKNKIFSVLNIEEMINQCEVIFITTPDGIIQEVVKEISGVVISIKTKAVFHMSGSLSAEVLYPLKEKNMAVGVLHPLQSLASVDSAIANIPGSYFSFEGDKDLFDWVQTFVELIGAKLITGIEPGQKVLYHAGASIVSNFLVVLMQMGISCFKDAGFKESEAQNALIPLMKGTLNNMSQLSVQDALTGPVVRGDSETIKNHLSSMKKGPSELIPAYRSLALIAAKLANDSDKLSDDKFKELIAVLNTGKQIMEGINNE